MDVLSVNVGRPRLVAHRGHTYNTAINKHPVAGRVALSALGLEGDQQADPRNHGGPEMAMCVYPHEHYARFAELLGVELPVPSFGENLTARGWFETEACIGDVYRIGGGVRVSITKPREPCSKLARKHDSPDLLAWIHRTLFTGFYLRVVEPGTIAAGDAIELVDRPHPGLSVAGAMRAMFAPDADAELLRAYSRCESLAAGWRRRIAERLQKINS